MKITTLQAGHTLLEESLRLNVPVTTLKAATGIKDANQTLETAWSIPNLPEVSAAKAKSLPKESARAQATGNNAAGQLLQHTLAKTHVKRADVTLDHANRGAAGALAADELRPPAIMATGPSLVSYREAGKSMFWIPEGLFIRQMANSSKDPAGSMDEAIVPPGVKTALHTLKCDERYLITEGSGTVDLGRGPQKVGPGDVVLWPAGTPQRIINDTNDLLKFWCVCSPRFVPSDYTHVEDASVPYKPLVELPAGGKSGKRQAETELDVILSSGAGIIKIGNDERELRAGELAHVPKGATWELTQIDDKPLVALARST